MKCRFVEVKWNSFEAFVEREKQFVQLIRAKFKQVTHLKFVASFQDAFLDRLDLVARQVQQPQAVERLKLNGGEDWIQ